MIARLFCIALLALLSSLTAQASLVYEVDSLNDTITLNGSAFGGPTQITPDFNVISWAKQVASGPGTLDSSLTFVSGSVDLSNDVELYETTMVLTSNNGFTTMGISMEVDVAIDFTFTFNDYTWSYAGASADQKTALEDSIFGADLPLGNVLGTFSDFTPIPEPGATATMLGLSVLVGLVAYRRFKRDRFSFE